MTDDRMEPEVSIRPVGSDEFGRYAEVPIRFLVDSVLVVEAVDGGFGGLVMREQAVASPYVKDYDAYDCQGPVRWAEKFDVSRWLFLLAESAGRPIGAATVAFDTAAVEMLDGRADLAALWDLRVHPDWRGMGVGKALFARAMSWARQRGCTRLKVETQNVNVRACRFYADRNCELRMLDRDGYAGHAEAAHEAKLYWYLDL